MEQAVETKKPSNGVNKAVIGVAAAVVAAAVGITAYTLSNAGKQDGEAGNQPAIGYAAEAKVMLDQDSLQAAVDEAIANAQNNQVALRYQNDAFSADGQTISCRIVNDSNNLYDMYLTIFADAELTDQIYLSGLVAPGSGFEEITLSRALDPGDHTVYVVVTQVDTDENGAQAVKNQVVHTMDFHVTS